MNTDEGMPVALQEQIARINQLQSDALRKQQEVRLAPWQLVLGGITAGAALFAAGAAFTKLLFG